MYNSLNKIIPVGGFTVVHSGPSDASDCPVDPPSGVNWTMNTTAFGTLIPQGGPFTVDALFQSNGVRGIVTITMACQDKLASVTITVVEKVVLPFDHFNPSFD